MDPLWIHNGLVWTGGDEPRVLAGGVLCRDGVIQAVGPDAELEPQAARTTRLDAQGRLILPGFVNAHMHLYSTLARGMALKDDPPENFVQILERLWWRLDKVLTPDDLLPSAEVVLIDALRAGVTTLIDHHASPGAIDGSLDALEAAASRAGLRFSTCYEVSDRDGEEKMRAGIRENLRFAEKVRGDPMRAGMFGLHASFTLSDDTLAACVDAARQANLPFHVHVAEAASDAEDARRRGFEGALHRLHDRGAITPGTLAVHCVHTGPGEWTLLRDADAFAVHNPQSNMNNAVGAAAVRHMLAAGAPVGIGTDGMQADVREDIRAAFLLGHHRAVDPRTMWAEIPRLLDANRRIASRLFALRVGELAEGAAADVVIYEYFPPTELSADNFTGHLLFGLHAAPARTVVINGSIRLRDGVLTTMDPQEVAARAREQAARLWSRF